MAGLSNVTVFNKWVYTTVNEMLAQQIELFNGATRNAIILRNANNTGDFSDSTFWADVAGMVRRRDPYSDANVSAIDLQMIVDTMVKVAGGTPPINIPPVMFMWINQNPELGAANIAKQLAPKIMQDMLNTAVAALSAAMRQEASNVTDVSGGSGDAAKFTPANVNVGQAKFGDRAAAIVCWVVHSKAIFDYYGNAITNANQLYSYDTVNVTRDPFGRIFVVSDIPALAISGPKYVALGLVSGAAIIERNDDMLQNIETSNGGENIRRTYQAEWSYNLGVKGFTWDKTNGGKAPSNAALALGTNWDKTVTSTKDLPGVVVITV